MALNEAQWKLCELVSQDMVQQFPNMHPVLLQLLYNRHIRTKEEIDLFLGPDWSRDIFSPHLFTQMDRAVERIFSAIDRRESITVHGDYDADGVCGSAVLITVLRDIARPFGYDVGKISSYIPHREKEGYGMSVPTIEYLHEHEKSSLVITVDCGISNKLAIDRGRDLGIDTIVCDHHTMPELLPDQAILIHPLVPGEIYPNKHLCGTGVAFKLACALYEHARLRGVTIVEGYEKWLLDLVAIATVTDVMPMIGENRLLEQCGLRVLNKTRRIGLRKLIEIAGGTFGKLDTVSIGFLIGPRLNAAGRINHASAALNLLIEEDEVKATQLAMRLHETNTERQRISKRIYDEAKSLFQDAVGISIEQPLLVAVSDSWSPGMVGLVAGKLVSEFHRPAFVIGKHEDVYVGSGRTVGKFDVTAALRSASDYLEKFGGHPQACGFSIRGKENLAKAIETFQAFAHQHIQLEDLCPTILCDAQIQLEDVTWELFDALERMHPYGRGNEESIFCAYDLTLVSFATVGGNGQHLKLSVQSPLGRIMPAIAFGFGPLVHSLQLGGRLDLVFSIRANEWNGNRELQLFVKDVRI